MTQWKQLIICLTRAYPLFVGNDGDRDIIISFTTQQEKQQRLQENGNNIVVQKNDKYSSSDNQSRELLARICEFEKGAP